MKPLKQTTALSTIATSAFLYVPSMHTTLAFAEGGSTTSNGASALTELASVAPFAIAISSAVAIASALGIGMELHKRRQQEQERYMTWVSDNLTGASSIDWSALSKQADEHEEVSLISDEQGSSVAEEQTTPTLEVQEQPMSVSQCETVIETNDANNKTSINSSPNLEVANAKVTTPDVTRATSLPKEQSAEQAATSSEKPNSTVNDLLSWDKNSRTTGSFRPEYTAGGTYIPRHAVKRDNQAESKISNMSNNTFINNLESKYSDILGDVRNPWNEEPKHLANPVAAKIEMNVPLINDPSKPMQTLQDTPKATVTLEQEKQYSEKPAYQATAKKSGMTSADKVASALANKKSLEDAATEIAKVGKISALASAATATALRNAGVHAVVRNTPDMAEHANESVPIKRGPGFVDVNDNTFIRTGGKVSKLSASIPSTSASAAVSHTPNTSQYTLNDNLPVADGRVLSCTDSISDFRCNIVSKTYRTQGDMVQVEYSQSRTSDNKMSAESSGRIRRESSRDKTISFASGIRPAVALASVPLI